MRALGSGAYATVKLATQKSTKKKVAMKIYPKYKLDDPNKKRSVIREILCMKKLEHPNTIKLLDSFETPKEIYLIQEYISGVSLYQFIKNKSTKRVLPEELVSHFFR
jgi:MAP/microtubule affinity-regulating kinase